MRSSVVLGALVAVFLIVSGCSSNKKRSDAHAELIDPEFTKQVLRSKEPVVVDYWAEWCPPCRIVGPILEELAAQSDGKWKLVKVNAEDSAELAEHYEIESLPTLIIYKNGKEHRRMEGIPAKNTKAALAAWIKKGIE